METCDCFVDTSFGNEGVTYCALHGAAPDMLAALEAVFYHLDSPEIRDLACWKQARAAMVKASRKQGEPHDAQTA